LDRERVRDITALVSRERSRHWFGRMSAKAQQSISEIVGLIA
jgi:hypothetical protein